MKFRCGKCLSTWTAEAPGASVRCPFCRAIHLTDKAEVPERRVSLGRAPRTPEQKILHRLFVRVMKRIGPLAEKGIGVWCESCVGCGRDASLCAPSLDALADHFVRAHTAERAYALLVCDACAYKLGWPLNTALLNAWWKARGQEYHLLGKDYQWIPPPRCEGGRA